MYRVIDHESTCQQFLSMSIFFKKGPYWKTVKRLAISKLCTTMIMKNWEYLKNASTFPKDWQRKDCICFHEVSSPCLTMLSICWLNFITREESFCFNVYETKWRIKCVHIDYYLLPYPYAIVPKQRNIPFVSLFCMCSQKIVFHFLAKKRMVIKYVATVSKIKCQDA